MAKGISVPVTQSGLEASIQQGVKNVGKVNIPVNVDPSAFKNLAQPLGRVSGLATEFEKSIAASNARVLAFGASVGIINGVQNAFADLVRTGIDVQKTLADIAAISGKGGTELSKFGDALFDVAKNTSQSFKTASQAALEFSRQGLSTEETLKRTNDALTLTRFTTLNAAEAVDVLTAAANSFADTGITTAQIINKLVAVDTKFAVSAEDLANGLARAGSIAQEVGVSFDELNAAVTITQERTARGGAVIGNALKTIFTRLRSDETVQALRDIGVESLNAQGELKGAIPILQEVASKIQGLGGGERVQILEAVASKYNINILSALLDDLNNANSKFGEAVAISAGANNQAYERQIELNKTLAAQINGVTVSVTQLFNKLAEIGVTENLNSLLKFVNDLIGGFNKLLDSEGTGANIAKGIIKGLSDVFFTVGLPIIGAIFVKLTKDVAQFGVESLKTILGINQQVRERQALEQAVVNTLIRDQEVMATILALSGNRAKQEEYLLGIYNRQLAALQQVQSIATSVTPALMAGGLSATSGQIKKRGAGGYLPAQEAADIRRGVGGANSSARVVSIPNFAFGGGKRGTMIANTSEYIVPNFANGGSAIFNKDMVKAYGLPAGARKISAAGGYVPNFARYVYDADRIEPDKNALLKAIIASGAKKNLIVGPAGAGKSTYGAKLGSFITNVSQLADATEIDILSGAARTKDGGLSKNFQQIADAVNASGGRVSYLYAGNMDLYSRRIGRMGNAPMEGDLRSQKQLSGSLYAPMNQFDFISKVKKSARNFEMIRGAGGYIPNFADVEFTGKYAGIVPSKVAGDPIKTGRAKNGKLYSFPMIYAGSSSQSKGNIDEIRNEVVKVSQNLAVRAATDYATAFDPDLVTNSQAVAQKATQANQNKGAIESFVGSIFEASVASLLDDQHFKESQERSTISTFDFVNNSRLQKIFGIPNGVQFLEAKNNAFEGNLNKIAEKISKVESGGAAFSQKRPTLQNSNKPARYFYEGGQGYLEQEPGVFRQADLSQYKLGPTQKKAGLPKGATVIRGAMGYIPNFAKGGPLEDAIQREMAAGLNPSQIRVTQDGRLRNSQNPNGLAVINTRDEPNGKIPNFAKKKNRNRAVANPEAYSEPIGPQLSQSAANTAIGLDKLFFAMSGLTILTSTLESTFGKLNNGAADFVVGLSKMAQGASQGALLGGTAKELLGSKVGRFGGAALPIAGAVLGVAAEAIGAYTDSQMSAIENAPAKAAGIESVKDITKKEDIQKQLSARRKWIMSGTTSDKENAAYDELKKKLSEIVKQEKQQAEQEKKNVEEMRKRIVLATAINSINETFSRDQNQRDIKRAENYAKLIESSANLTEQQKFEQGLQQKSLEFGHKREDLKRNELKEALNIVTTASKLATVDKDALDNLLKRVEEGGNLLDVQKELEKLSSEGAINAASQLNLLRSRTKEQLGSLTAEERRTILLERANNSLQNQVKTYQVINDSIRNIISLSQELQDIMIESDLKTKEFGMKRPVAEIEKTISKQPFATREQAYQLSVAKDILKVKSEELSIEQERESQIKTAERNYRRSLSSGVQNLSYMSPSDKNLAAMQIQEAQNAQDALNIAKKFASGRPTKETADETKLNNEQELNFNRQLVVEGMKLSTINENAIEYARQRLEALDRTISREQMLAKIRKESPLRAGAISAMESISEEAYNFEETFAKNTTLAFRDGMRDALSAAISQTDDLNGALQNVAMNFLKTMQNAFLQQASNSAMMGIKSAFPSVFNFAKGGLVSGGSGYRDDVPAMLTGGEFVMRKSAVQKYGAENLRKMNDGGIFLPGVRGGGAISGYDALRAFANQTTTSGATDILRGSGSSAFINLEDQSARLSRYALLGDDTINQEIRSAQEQGLNIIQQREAYRTQQRKAFQQQLVGTVASAALSAGFGMLKRPAKAPNDPFKGVKIGDLRTVGFLEQAYGGMIRRYASGGPVDDVPALLMSGEYVMNRQSSSKYGKRLLDSMNQGRLPRFADGGEVGGSTTTTTESNAKMMGDVSININVSGQTSQTEAQGNTNQGGIDYKKMSERIKAVVIETINEEKRLGGSLRSR